MLDDVNRVMSKLRAWDSHRDGVGESPSRLACSISDGASEEEVARAWSGMKVPPDLVELWTHARSARLFEDIDYGQWGLRLLSPTESAARTASELYERPGDFAADDIVVGEFLGDQELLVCAGEGDAAAVLIALPLDPRRDWYLAASSVSQFLERYLAPMFHL